MAYDVCSGEADDDNGESGDEAALHALPNGQREEVKIKYKEGQVEKVTSCCLSHHYDTVVDDQWKVY